jgi:hypothetical protein
MSYSSTYNLPQKHLRNTHTCARAGKGNSSNRSGRRHHHQQQLQGQAPKGIYPLPHRFALALQRHSHDVQHLLRDGPVEPSEGHPPCCSPSSRCRYTERWLTHTRSSAQCPCVVQCWSAARSCIRSSTRTTRVALMYSSVPTGAPVTTVPSVAMAMPLASAALRTSCRRFAADCISGGTAPSPWRRR